MSRWGWIWGSLGVVAAVSAVAQVGWLAAWLAIYVPVTVAVVWWRHRQRGRPPFKQ
jgi:hypothetical protein